ncbi:MAG: acyl carrier protein [Deltaproteobacteria bacterium]|nr:acyl carrier protein [Deltaproteobacteria bacterium]
MSIAEEVRQYIIDNFMYSADAEDLTETLHLFDNGIIDSTGVLELVSFLEETFDVQVEDEEMLPENFETIAALTAFVTRKQPPPT